MLDETELLTKREAVWATATGVGVVLVLIGVGFAVGVYWCPLG